MKRSHLVLLCLLVAVGVALLYDAAYRQRPFTPVQPIPFNHTTHTATDRAHIPCLACHPTAESGRRAGMAPAALCLDCHRHILADDPRLAPLHAAANPDAPAFTGEGIPWIRTDALPGYVHFDHRAHARKGIACERCHPSPGTSGDTSMAACLQCHRDEQAPIGCPTCHH